MTTPASTALWVSGERLNVEYLLDTVAGRVVRKAELRERGGVTGGIGRPCSGLFVAVYVAPERDHVVLQVGTDRMPLDGTVRAAHKCRFGGALSILEVSAPGYPDLTARQWNGPGAFFRRVDPAYDDLDHLSDDFLADVANIVSSRERQEWLMTIKDPAAGPWIS